MENNQKLAIDLASPEQVRQLIADTPSGLYGSVTEDGEKLAVYVDQGEWLDVHVYQKNGWIRVDSYGPNGIKDSETFTGRYDTSEA